MKIRHKQYTLAGVQGISFYFQYRGYGIDVQQRQIWSKFDSKTDLRQQSFNPASDQSVFSDVEWIIGNHSDELTPWIPVLAAK